MGVVKNFIDELAKHKMLVYFVTLWGATLFLNEVYALTAWGIDGFYWVGSSVVVDLFFHFSELFAGVILAILGVKLLRTGFLETLKNERLLVYFLMLWAASFFFRGLWYMIDFGPAIFENIGNPIAFLGALAMLAAGAVLGLFSWKMLNEPKQEST